MTGYRGTDEAVEREIATLETIVQVRLRRYAAEMKQLDRELSELRREKARRRALAAVPSAASTESAVA